MKAVEPLIATTLLIALAVVLAGLVGLWLSKYTSSSQEQITKQEEEERTCVQAGISLTQVRYCNNYLSGKIDNTGLISLKNISLIIIYQNNTQQKIVLNDSANNPLTIHAQGTYVFNISSSPDYDEVWILTHCPQKKANIGRSEVLTC